MRFFYDFGIVIEECRDVYFPREDSLFIADYLKNVDMNGKKALDVGCGSGFLSILMNKLGADVFSTDINKNALKCAMKNSEINKSKLHLILTNVFDGLGKFDFIIFNAPYLPEGEEDDIMWSNTDAVEKFLNEFREHLNDGGRAIFILSTLSKALPKDSPAKTLKLDFETLLLFDIKRI